LPVVLSPDWIEAIASLLTLGIIIFLTLYAVRIQKQLSETSIQAQKDFINREEAYRVKPILLISSGGIQKGTAYLKLENIGRGDAFHVNLNVTLSKWLEPDGKTGQSVPVSSRRVPRGTLPSRLDTRVKKGDITENIDGDLIVWGNMLDEENRSIQVKRLMLPCENFLVHQHTNQKGLAGDYE
jgi:hypothetical protein